MKKIVFVLIVLFLSVNFASAKEQKTFEQALKEGCGTAFQTYEQNKSNDNQINATECVYKYAKAYKKSTLSTSEDLYYLYGLKYNNSANNPDYLNKMYKYAFKALEAGSKNLYIIESAVYLAVIKNDISRIDYAYEIMAETMPEKAKAIKQEIVTAKSEINQRHQVNRDNFFDLLTIHRDELTGEMMTNNEIQARNNAMLLNGANLQNIYMQKKQTDALHGINKNTANINQNLQNLNYSINDTNRSLHGIEWAIQGAKYGF